MVCCAARRYARTSREKCRGKIKFTTRDRRAICSTARRGGGRGGEERNERTNGRRMKAVAGSGV